MEQPVVGAEAQIAKRNQNQAVSDEETAEVLFKQMFNKRALLAVGEEKNSELPNDNKYRHQRAQNGEDGEHARR